MKLAEQAKAEFDKTDLIPNLGQRMQGGLGPGTVHIFPDGSLAIHGDDATFTVAELREEVEGA